MRREQVDQDGTEELAGAGAGAELAAALHSSPAHLGGIRKADIIRPGYLLVQADDDAATMAMLMMLALMLLALLLSVTLFLRSKNKRGGGGGRQRDGEVDAVIKMDDAVW